jgi:hypothetical protein
MIAHGERRRLAAAMTFRVDNPRAASNHAIVTQAFCRHPFPRHVRDSECLVHGAHLSVTVISATLISALATLGK